jgi:hypothetical protein
LSGDDAAIKRIIDGFGESATVDFVRNMTLSPAAQHVARFTHGFPNAGNAGIRHARVEGKPFYGFDEENFSSLTRLDGAETEVNFRFRLLDSRDGKDIYEITRTVVERKGLDGPVTSESKGQPVTVTVEYAGKELVVFDDEYGIGKFVPAPEIAPNQDDEAQFDLPEVEVEREPGEVESELWLNPLHGRVDEQPSHGQNNG